MRTWQREFTRPTAKADPNPCGSTTLIECGLPRFIDTTYWEMLRLTADDVSAICERVQADAVWLLAMCWGIDASFSCTRASFATFSDVSISSKGIALKKVMRRSGIRLGHIPRARSIRDHISVAIHPVDTMTFDTIKRNIYPSLPPGVVHTISYALYNFDSYWLPVSIESDGVLLARLEPAEDTRPLSAYVTYNNVIYKISEDAILATQSQ